jgi:hypothetical protein
VDINVTLVKVKLISVEPVLMKPEESPLTVPVLMVFMMIMFLKTKSVTYVTSNVSLVTMKPTDVSNVSGQELKLQDVVAHTDTSKTVTFVKNVLPNV